MRLLRRDLVCQQAVELVTDYLEDRLPPRQRRRFQAHLAACPHCTTYLEQIRTTIRVAGEVDTDRLAPETREGLLDLYRRYRSEE
jgi:anti-sigma factor RsiW